MLCRVAAVTATGLWALMIVDALPGIDLIPAESQMLLLAGAITISVLVCVQRTRRPEEEIFEAGREYERRCILKQMNAARAGKVTPLRRAVNDDAVF